MVLAGSNYTEHLLSMGAERAGKCRNESAFGENGFRRSASAENGEPKRFSTFRYTPYRLPQKDLSLRARRNLSFAL